MFHGKSIYLSRFLLILINITLILNLLALIFLPFLLRLIYDNPDLFHQLEGRALTAAADGTRAESYPADLPPHSYPFYLVFLYASGLSTAMILFAGRRILGRVIQGEPFHSGQPASFRCMAAALLILFLAFFSKIFLYNTLLTLFCTVLFLIFTLVALIFADLFHQAWQAKTENDLTI